jgi:hypothetical protein
MIAITESLHRAIQQAQYPAGIYCRSRTAQLCIARGYHPGSSQRRYTFRCSQQFSPTANA